MYIQMLDEPTVAFPRSSLPGGNKHGPGATVKQTRVGTERVGKLQSQPESQPESLGGAGAE